MSEREKAYNLVRLKTTVCQGCLDGKGEECHTPGCVLFLHAVDIPWMPELYEVLETIEVDE